MLKSLDLSLKDKQCGCKGIRSCKLCDLKFTGDKEDFTSMENSCAQQDLNIFQFCVKTKKLIPFENDPRKVLELHSKTSQPQVNGSYENERGFSETLSESNKFDETDSISNDCDVALTQNSVPTAQATLEDGEFAGIDIIEDFVSEEEELNLEREIMATTFVNSQSGRRKQDFGPKVNFKRQKVKTGNFNGLPSYSKTLYERMKLHTCLEGFEPVEMCNLEYCASRGAHIDSHFDDWWLWGERLVTLNLLSDSTLTFTKDSKPSVLVRVPLKQRSLIVVSGLARFKWKHSILVQDVSGRRIAMTFRELSEEFDKGGKRESDGLELLNLALTFQGVAIG